MELGRVVSPEAIREALDLAREEFFRPLPEGQRRSPEAEQAFLEETEFSSYSGPMLAGGRAMWACRDEGRLRGFLSLDNAREVGLFYVSKEYRRHGIGRALIAAAIEYAQQNGENELEAFVPPEQEHFFSRLGFERTEEETPHTEHGLQGVRMICDLTI